METIFSFLDPHNILCGLSYKSFPFNLYFQDVEHCEYTDTLTGFRVVKLTKI